MYCGDETGSYIGDIGSHSCRFGYGGEDNPKLVVPSYVIRNKQQMASSCLSSRMATQELDSILRRPIITENVEGGQPITDPSAFLVQGDSVANWEALQIAWDTSMETLHAKDTLKHTKGGTPYSTITTTTTSHAGTMTSSTIKSTSASNPGDGGGKCVHPILAVTPAFTHLVGYGPEYCETVRRQQYIQYTEMLMESMDASSMFLAPSSMLSAFSLGRQTALMVDIGAGGCRVTPIVDGLVLEHAQRRNGRGAEWLNHCIWKALVNVEKKNPQPLYQVRAAGGKHKLIEQTEPIRNVHPLYRQWAMQEYMFQIRTAPFVTLAAWNQGKEDRIPFGPSPSSTQGSDSSSASMSAMGGNQSQIYELPDGTTIDLSTTTGKDFTRVPELLFTDAVPFDHTSPSSALYTLSDLPLHKMIQQSLLAVADVDVRKELAGCICLVGGASIVGNLEARLSAELTSLLPTMVKPKVVASRNSIERSCAAWIGASILSSLGSFQQLWLSRTEYEEYGTTLSIQRFP